MNGFDELVNDYKGTQDAAGFDVTLAEARNRASQYILRYVPGGEDAREDWQAFLSRTNSCLSIPMPGRKVSPEIVPLLLDSEDFEEAADTIIRLDGGQLRPEEVHSELNKAVGMLDDLVKTLQLKEHIIRAGGIRQVLDCILDSIPDSE
jgi:hypothetical protein